MANRWYSKGKEAFAGGDAAWDTDAIKVVLVDAADYTVNTATHQFLSDIAAAGRVATSSSLTSKTFTDGVLDAADVTISAVTGDTVEYVVVYQDTGNAATSRLLVLFDTGAGLPLTPNGGDVTIQWDNGASKIAVL